VSTKQRDYAKASIVTLVPTGLGYIGSGWVVGVICLFVAGGLSLVLWTSVGRWLGYHHDEPPSPHPARRGYVGLPGSKGNLSRATFGDKLDTAIENEGEVDAREAEFE